MGAGASAGHLSDIDKTGLLNFMCENEYLKRCNANTKAYVGLAHLSADMGKEY
jgi:hypothetical protein